MQRKMLVVFRRAEGWSLHEHVDGVGAIRMFRAYKSAVICVEIVLS
jgi:hypothetical protein